MDERVDAPLWPVDDEEKKVKETAVAVRFAGGTVGAR
jgi:hypothetical protein